jgi:hypothetical protein
VRTGLGKLFAMLAIAALLAAGGFLLVGDGTGSGPTGIAQADTPKLNCSRDNWSDACEEAYLAFGTLEEQLYKATLRKNEERLLTLLDQNPDIVDLRIADGQTALSEVAYMGSLQAVRILLKKGADPDLGTPSPLSRALVGSRAIYDPDVNLIEPPIPHYQIIVDLIEAGANYEYYEYKDMSFVEAMIYDVCDNFRFQESHLSIFSSSNIIYNSKQNT